MPVVMKYSGDEHAANLLRQAGLLQLDILHNLMGFQNLTQDMRTVVYDDGTRIHCRSCFGTDIVDIYVPPMPVELEEPQYYNPLVAVVTDKALREYYFYEVTGSPVDGDLEFKGQTLWGTADHVWFLADSWEYWVLDNGVIYYKDVDPNTLGITDWAELYDHITTRQTGYEGTCTGLPAYAINEFSVIRSLGTYRMVASLRIDEEDWEIREYTSSNGLDWVCGSEIAFNYGFSQIEGTPTPTTPGDWANVENDRFHIEIIKRIEEPEEDYPDYYYRIYRIGVRERWDENGELNTEEICWTSIASATSLMLYHMEFENSFTVEGGHSGLQVTQIVGSLFEEVTSSDQLL